jgi:hypothetical protein
MGTQSKRLLSPTVVVGILLVEVTALLIAPAVYYTLFVPKTNGENQHLPYPASDNGTYPYAPLTRTQIETAWPNLPTAKQIVETGYEAIAVAPMNGEFPNGSNVDEEIGYAVIDTSFWQVEANSTSSTIYLTRPPGISFVMENRTEPLFSYMGPATMPVWYRIYLQYNSTIWIEVPENLLLSDRYSSDRSGFLGTGLPMAYVAVAVAVIVATAVAYTSYLVLTKKKQ